MMAVTPDDVRHVALLARLGLTPDALNAYVAELNTILEHMDVLSRVDTEGVEPVAGIGAAGAPLRPDDNKPVELARAIADFAPKTKDGFFLVPRLSSHEEPGAA
jgi:aspartyl-tRNA(Asn)/glutamyl-tRNA(Gln) amidotransferase subunit C